MPTRTAVICGEAKYTYAEIDAQANKVANALREIGVEKGDKVALSCPNVPYFPLIYYGILKAGAVVVPPQYSAERTRNRLSSRRFGRENIFLF